MAQHLVMITISQTPGGSTDIVFNPDEVTLQPGDSVSFQVSFPPVLAGDTLQFALDTNTSPAPAPEPTIDLPAVGAPPPVVPGDIVNDGTLPKGDYDYDVQLANVNAQSGRIRIIHQ